MNVDEYSKGGKRIMVSASSTPSPDKQSRICIEYKPLTRLKTYPHNARTHSKRQVRQIADSIASFGFTNPILIDESSTIVAGHGRLRAAELLGIELVPTIRLSLLTPAQVRAYVMADNRLAEKAGWDEEILKIEMQQLILDDEIDISVTGFEVAEIDLILNANTEKEDEDDSIPEVAATVTTQPGDLWFLGKHRIFCGDARQESSLSALMQSARASIVFTDPPYNVIIDGHATGNGRTRHNEFRMASGEMSKVEFTEFLTASLSKLAAWTTDGSVHFVCMDWRHMPELLAAGGRVYDSLLNVCVWSKDNGGMGSLYRSQHELVFVYKNGNQAHRNNVQLGRFGRYRTNVWHYPGANTMSRTGEEGNLLAMHPTVKPVALVADALLDCSAPGEIVLDSFLGSGSTLIAADRIGRVCYALEIEPKYVDLAIRRWQSRTGGRARHAKSNRNFDEIDALKGPKHE
jgi:DNA modification methylase